MCSSLLPLWNGSGLELRSLAPRLRLQTIRGGGGGGAEAGEGAERTAHNGT